MLLKVVIIAGLLLGEYYGGSSVVGVASGSEDHNAATDPLMWVGCTLGCATAVLSTSLMLILMVTLDDKLHGSLAIACDCRR